MKPIELETQQFKYLIGTNIKYNGLNYRIQRLVLEPLDNIYVNAQTFDEFKATLKTHMYTLIKEINDPFKATLTVTNGETQQQLDIVNLLPGVPIVLVNITPTKDVSFAKDIDTIDDIIRTIADDSMKTPMFAVSMHPSVYFELFKLTTAIDNNWLEKWIAWNQDIYSKQVHMVRNYTYPLKVEWVNNEIPILRANTVALDEHWDVTSLVNKQLAQSIEEYISKIAWRLATTKHLDFKDYIQQLPEAELFQQIANDWTYYTDTHRVEGRVLS